MDSTYNKLIEAGIKLFGESGIDSVSIRDIVAESGVNLSAVSYHFGGKGELYKAVIVHLIEEVHKKLTDDDVKLFETLSIVEMEQVLPSIILKFHDLFLSKNGLSRLSIFTRELASVDKYCVHHYFFEMIEHVRKIFSSILIFYYQARGESTDKVEFVISLLVAMLNNMSCKETVPLLAKYKYPDTMQRMINLILYSKL